MIVNGFRKGIVGIAAACLVVVPVGIGASATGVVAGPAASPEAESGGGPVAESAQVTLITGDRLQVDTYSDGRQSAAIEPAARDGYEPTFQTVQRDGQLYVFPSDAAALIPQTLDRELFNVTKLASYDADEGVPSIVQRAASASARTLTTVPGIEVTATLSSIDAVAATVGADWWSSITDQTTSPTARSLTSATALASVQKVWLDEEVEVELDESVAQIGASHAWEAGLDGNGVTVAVLDTGIDLDHPDMAGQVSAHKSFVPGVSSVHDGHGHGTHVASTIAGSGAVSDGLYAGVAPGADLIVGKVLNDFGSGAMSQIIDGMEWAAAEGADIVNLSLGCGPRQGCLDNDGTDPASQAVNRLTATTDTLFVIAAGNDGPGEQTLGTPGVADAALTVGAVDGTDQLADFSSRGPRFGDHAIKPDVTAPGVDIAAARAAGTNMRGTAVPVDDHYIRASGTSMATPHVAGAAALLLQSDPTLAPVELKAALSTTGVPVDGASVFEQGGGRIDVPQALDATVQSSPTPLDLGFFRYPHDDTAPVTKDVTYTNVTDTPITLELALNATNEEGTPADVGLVSLGADSLTIEPGATASVTVTVDVAHGDFGRYGGYLMGSVDGEPVTRTALSFTKESERYDLTISGVARDGQAARFNSSVNVHDVEDMGRFDETGLAFVDGAVTVRVPRGTYALMGLIETYVEDQPVAHERSFVAEPEVEVTGDTTVVLDARAAQPIQVEPEGNQASAPRDHTTMAYYRSAADSGEQGVMYLGPAWPQYSATPTDPVTRGEFEFYSHWRLGEPELVASVTEPVSMEVEPLYFVNSPSLDGEVERRVVDAGQGSPEEFANVDVDDAIALVQRGGPSFGSKEANARAAGAAAVIVANNAPGQIANYGVNADAAIPAIKISQADGEALYQLLADGDVTMRLVGHRDSGHLYELVLAEPDRIGTDLHYDVGRDSLATVRNRFHSDVQRFQDDQRDAWRPWMATSVVFLHSVYAPSRRTEYVVADNTRYSQKVDGMREPVSTYTPRQSESQAWSRPVLAPGAPDLTNTGGSGAAYRTGDSLLLRMASWTDAEDHWALRQGAVDTTSFRLYENDTLVAEAQRPRGTFAVSPGPGQYRLEYDVTRDAEGWHTSTATRTVWTTTSHGTTGAPQTLPLLDLDFDVPVDLSNTLERHGNTRRIGVDVGHIPGVEGASIDSLQVWISYDDGATWSKGRTRRVDGGHYDVDLPRPDRVPGGGFASVKAVAADDDGNTIEQEVIRAWKLPAG